MAARCLRGSSRRAVPPPPVWTPPRGLRYVQFVIPTPLLVVRLGHVQPAIRPTRLAVRPEHVQLMIRTPLPVIVLVLVLGQPAVRIPLLVIVLLLVFRQPTVTTASP